MAAANFYVRKTGSAANGGSSTGASPQRTGSDGVTNGTTTFTSVTGAFVSGDVDKLINIVGKGRYRITAVGSSTSVTLSGSPTAGTGLTWNLGGACLNIGDLLQAAAGTVANGDAIWVGAGVYRETIACTNTNTAEVTVNGDVDGAKTGDAGMVQLTGYTTNDKTAPSATTLLNLAGHDFLTFNKIMFVYGNATGITATTTTSTDIKFQDCAFLHGRLGNQTGISVTAAFATALNWTFDRCLFLSGTANVMTVTLTRGTGADYDANVLVRNCYCSGAGGTWINVASTGAGVNFGGGVRARNCFLYGSHQMMATSASISTGTPCTVNNSFLWTSNAASLNANASGQITEDYNLIVATTPRTNVTAGTHSISDGSYAPLFHFGQERIWGALLRAYGEPMASSPLLGFGNDGNQTAYDLRNKLRPAGGASSSPAAGAMERGNTFITDPSPIGAGGSAMKVTGPGYAEFLVPVPATTVTISCKVKWDATYAGTKPQLQIDARAQIGVAAETKTATGGSGSNETLTLTAITPTAAGQMVTIRVISNDTNGGGVLQVDDFAAAT